MRICYFGTFDPAYSRNKILIRGLEENGVEVLECRTEKGGVSKYFDLFKKHWKLRKGYDVMVVGFPGFQAMILARFLTSKPIIFDAFVSMYDSVVLDRKQTSSRSLKAGYYWWLDKISMTLPEIVLFDTQSHIEYVIKDFGISDNKFVRIFLGADTDVFYSKSKDEWKPKGSKFKVGFYGHFIPLQGVEYIVRSAKLLEDHEDIVFEIIGDGQEKQRILDLVNELDVKNINFVGNVSLSEVAKIMSGCDVCLGIFGDTNKTKRVIPNKVYECIALGKPVVTADTPAIRELFDENDLFLTEISSPESIAKTILYIKENVEESERKAEKAHTKLIEFVSIEKLGLELKKISDTFIK